MDAAVAALIGAGTGSFATLIGHALQIWRDDRHQSRDLEDARRARLLDRRLAAHQVLYSILMKKIDYAEASSIDPDYPVSRKAMWAALDVVQVVSAPATSDAAEAVVRSVSELEKQIADGATVSVATVQPIRSAAQNYRRALLREVGAQD